MHNKPHSEKTKKVLSDYFKGRKHKQDCSCGFCGHEGRKHSQETKEKISRLMMGKRNGLGHKKTFEVRKQISAKMSFSNHPSWIENPKNYVTIHYRIRRLYGKADVCEGLNCNGKSKKYHWSNISGEYKLERTDWQKLCVSCHMIFDKVNQHGKR